MKRGWKDRLAQLIFVYAFTNIVLYLIYAFTGYLNIFLIWQIDILMKLSGQ